MAGPGVFRSYALIASAACALSSCMQVSAPAPTIGSGPSNPDAAVAEFVRLANGARADAGCSGMLVLHDAVARVAQAHSDDMRRRDYFDHVDPSGRTPMQRVQAAGIVVSAVAENIALGQPTGQAVFRSWMDSAGHRRNMLNCEYTHHGVGVAGGYWTHVLVRLR